MHISNLPGDAVSPVHPWGGVVINLNCASKVHKDVMDLARICCVMNASKDCTGGELVLLQPGLVLKLGHGDIVVFKSSEMAHCNLHYEGMRCSLVFNTDRCLKEWDEDRNGWETHHFFTSSKHIVRG
jgi:hypothetical protein